MICPLKWHSRAARPAFRAEDVLPEVQVPAGLLQGGDGVRLGQLAAFLHHPPKGLHGWTELGPQGYTVHPAPSRDPQP